MTRMTWPDYAVMCNSINVHKSKYKYKQQELQSDSLNNKEERSCLNLTFTDG